MATKKPLNPKIRRRAPVSSKTNQSSTISTVTDSQPTSTKFSFHLSKKILIPLVILGLLAVGFYFFKGFFIAATVNGQPISRISILQTLEKQNGKQAVESAVTKALIMQEAQKKNISISQEEVNAELKKIDTNLKAQGQTLDQALAAQGMTRKDLEEQIKLERIIDKLLGSDITITDADITNYIEANKEMLPQNTSSKEFQDSIKQQLRQQKLSEKFQTWLTDLRQKAKINYFVNY